jgi:hypothetical protein
MSDETFEVLVYIVFFGFLLAIGVLAVAVWG